MDDNISRLFFCSLSLFFLRRRIAVLPHDVSMEAKETHADCNFKEKEKKYEWMFVIQCQDNRDSMSRRLPVFIHARRFSPT